MDESRPEGSVELGTGVDEWRPMGDEERLVFGYQGGFHFEVHARIRGLEPGNPATALDECNPGTRFRGYFAETGIQVNAAGPCPLRLGYEPAGNGEYVLRAGIQLQFDTCLRDRDVDGRDFRLVVEVIDSKGAYAMDERTVTALLPADWVRDAGPTESPDAGAGDGDAGPGDGGSEDAGAGPDAGTSCPGALP